MAGVGHGLARAALWRQLKDRILHMVDEGEEQPPLIIDEPTKRRVSRPLLLDFSGFPNFAFDSRDVFTTWLVGQPQLRARLRKHHYAALKTRIVTSVHLEPISSREHFIAVLEHGLKAAGVKSSIADSARELIYYLPRQRWAPTGGWKAPQEGPAACR